MTAPAAAPEDNVQRMICFAGLVEAKIAHEINLMGNRMNWFVTSQSFLFGAYAVLVSYFAFYPFPPVGSPGGGATEVAHALGLLMLVLVPINGLITAFSVGHAVDAAQHVIDELADMRGDAEDWLSHRVLPTRLPRLSRRNRDEHWGWTDRAGHGPIFVIPVLNIAAWTIVAVAGLTSWYAQITTGWWWAVGAFSFVLIVLLIRYQQWVCRTASFLLPIPDDPAAAAQKLYGLAKRPDFDFDKVTGRVFVTVPTNEKTLEPKCLKVCLRLRWVHVKWI